MEEQKNINEKKEVISKDKKTFKLSTLIIVSVIALLVGALIMFLLSVCGVFTLSKVVARVNGETFSSNDLNNMVSSYLGDDVNMKMSLMLDSVDYEILNKKYQLTDEEKEELENYKLYYINYYGLPESYAEKYVTITKLRELLYLDYLAQNNISDEDVTVYYENDYIADIECEHLLIKTDSEKLTEKQSLNAANEIIKKLNSGKSFEEVVAEYENSEKYGEFTTHETFTCQSISSNSSNDTILFSNLESAFVDGLLALEDNTYSATPVKTSYGYHVIYRKNQSEKPALDEIKAEIQKVLAQEYAMSEEVSSTLYSEILINLRKENGFNIYDGDLKAAYEEYCKEATTEASEETITEESIEN